MYLPNSLISSLDDHEVSLLLSLSQWLGDDPTAHWYELEPSAGWRLLEGLPPKGFASLIPDQHHLDPSQQSTALPLFWAYNAHAVSDLRDESVRIARYKTANLEPLAPFSNLFIVGLNTTDSKNPKHLAVVFDDCSSLNGSQDAFEKRERLWLYLRDNQRFLADSFLWASLIDYVTQWGKFPLPPDLVKVRKDLYDEQLKKDCTVWFQPIVGLPLWGGKIKTQIPPEDYIKIEAFEALAREVHASQTYDKRPDWAFEIAELHGLPDFVFLRDRVLIEKAIQNYSRTKADRAHKPLHLNVSPSVLTSSNITHLHDLLKRLIVTDGLLEKETAISLELTEESDIPPDGSDSYAQSVINFTAQIHALIQRDLSKHIRIDLVSDDFGSGFTNAIRILCLKCDSIKIDKDIRKLDRDHIAAILDTADATRERRTDSKIRLVLEGLELDNPVGVDLLHESFRHNINSVQGWLLNEAGKAKADPDPTLDTPTRDFIEQEFTVWSVRQETGRRAVLQAR
ncbi:MAG: EAL domain-containing protein [Chloroflexi bacterium]|nr:EAL domain-containing protein [Chloroflexota bacterium]